MPTYEYRCQECEEICEFLQSFSDPPKRKCPSCGRHRLKKMISGGAGLIFKGSGFYITECTWMRKHGWRTPEWKLIRALEPDFHFKPAVELYNLNGDPDEDHNLAEDQPEVVAVLTRRMEEWIALRERDTGLVNPIFDQRDWHGHEGVGVFKSSQQAYDTLHIGDPMEARSLQAGLDSATDEIPEGGGGIQ